MKKGCKLRVFFYSILNARCDKIAIENPVMLKCFGLPSYDQKIEPFMFGEPWRKRTCLWLRGLPLLHSTKVVEPLGLWVGSTCASRDPFIREKYELHSNRDSKRRAKTFPGVAAAMAEQWAGSFLGASV